MKHSAFIIDEVALPDRVGGGVEQQAVRRFAVTYGTTSLLVVGFDILRQVAMHDKAHVCFVDPHAEGDGRDDD